MSTNVRFIKSLWRVGTMLSPSSQDPKHPATDTQIDTKAQFYKASSKSSPCNVPCDLGSAQEINFVAIHDHNFESSGVTIKFQGADNSAFSSGLVTRTLSYNATDIFAFVTALTKRYVRVRLEKGTDFTDYPQFATVICGKYFEPSRTFVKSYSKGREDFSEFEYSDSINLFAQDKPVLKKWVLPFKGLTNTDISSVLSLLEGCKTIKAFVVVFDYNSPNSDSHLVRFTELSSPEYQHVDYWNWEAPLIEVK